MPSKMIYAIVFFLGGCVSNAVDVQFGKTAVDFYRKYQSTSDRIKQFKNYSLEEQYEIFEFGNRVLHPPATYLGYPFAEQGQIIVPFLKAKLEATKDEVTIRDIALIYSEVARLKIYDFSKDVELISLLSRKINNMQGNWKDVTLKFLSEIQSGKLAR